MCKMHLALWKFDAPLQSTGENNPRQHFSNMLNYVMDFSDGKSRCSKQNSIPYIGYSCHPSPVYIDDTKSDIT